MLQYLYNVVLFKSHLNFFHDIFQVSTAALSTFAIHKSFKCAESITKLVFDKQKSWFSLFLGKNVIEDFLGFFSFGRKKDASSEQILKNLLGEDHNGFLLLF